ncbi:hypothetical protein G6F58_009131 [Rhizopus delemar]|nr:hypothetical protein G6F58_009131 [Rhizopus delemar]
MNLLFSVFICVGGLSGIIGSLFASRRFSKAFSIIVWISCVLSFILYIVSLVLITTKRDSTINSCRVMGFIGIGNPQTIIEPTHISHSSYYTPVKYPGLLTANAGTESECSAQLNLFSILFGVLIFIIGVIQIYFAYVVGIYAKRLKNGARHHRLHAQQIKDFEESRYHMSTVY